MDCRKAFAFTRPRALAAKSAFRSHRPFARRSLLSVALPLGLLCGLAMLGGLARAQGQDTAPQNQAAGTQGQPAAGTTQPGGSQELLDDIADINTLEVLNPLELTPDQIDKLITMVTNAKADYEKKVTALGASPLLKIADEIRSVKRHSLTGTPEPEDFKAKIAKIEKDFLAQRMQLNADNITRLSTEAHDILKARQVATASRLFKESGAQSQPGTGLFDNYVRAVFIDNPRIVTLLKEMRGAAGSAGNSGAGRAAGAGATGM